MQEVSIESFKALWNAVAERSGDAALDSRFGNSLNSRMLHNRTVQPKRRRRFALPAHSI